MKIKNLKYILGVVFGLCFFACNVSFGLLEASDPSQCSNVNGYNNNGYSMYTNPRGNVQDEGNTNNENWFYNNDVALQWRYGYHTNLVSLQGSVGDIISYKVSLLYDYDHSLGANGYSEVWHLQNALNQAGCSVRKDCKLGRDTSRTLFTCDICNYINSEYSEPDSLTSSTNIVCGSSKEKVTEGAGSNLCCKPIHCDNPQDTGGGCASYGPSYTVDGSGCCASSCDKPQGTGGGCTSYGPSYTVDGSGCCASSCDKPQDSVGGCASYGPTYILSGTCCIDNPCPNPPDITDPENPTCPQQGYVLGAGGCCEPPEPCTGNQYQSEGGGCQDCTGDTVASADHTKCICDSSKKCCGIQLNTVVPFIGDCIEMNTDSSRGDTTSVTSVTAFPILMQGLMKILMSAIMVFSFLMVIVAGLSMTTGGFGGSGFAKGKTILKNVIISLILLGCSGLILSLVNPSFFGG